MDKLISTIQASASQVFSQLNESFKRDNLTKIFIIIMLIAITVFYFNRKNSNEGFNNRNDYTANQYKSINSNIFDEEYVQLYDNIIMDQEKDHKMIDYIIEKTGLMHNNGIAVNLGSRTGNINNYLNDQYNIRSIGFDRSRHMIDRSREKYSNLMRDGTTDFQILNLDTLDSNNVSINSSNPVTLILCLNMELYYHQDIDTFFSKCYNLLEHGGYLILDLVDYKKFNTTNVYSRINHFNPNNLSIKRVNDSVVKFNDLVYNTRYRIFPNDLGNDTVWLTETVTNFKDNNSLIKEYIHDFNALTNQEIEDIAHRNNFQLVNSVDIQLDLGLQNYNDEYLYIFRK